MEMNGPNREPPFLLCKYKMGLRYQALLGKASIKPLGGANRARCVSRSEINNFRRSELAI